MDKYIICGLPLTEIKPNRTFIYLSGLPGVGKTTLGNIIQTLSNGNIIFQDFDELYLHIIKEHMGFSNIEKYDYNLSDIHVKENKISIKKILDNDINLKLKYQELVTLHLKKFFEKSIAIMINGCAFYSKNFFKQLCQYYDYKFFDLILNNEQFRYMSKEQKTNTIEIDKTLQKILSSNDK